MPDESADSLRDRCRWSGSLTSVGSKAVVVGQTSGVARNVNWGASRPLPPPSLPLPLAPPLPLLTGVRGYNPRNFFEIKGARRCFRAFWASKLTPL